LFSVNIRHEVECIKTSFDCIDFMHKTHHWATYRLRSSEIVRQLVEQRIRWMVELCELGVGRKRSVIAIHRNHVRRSPAKTLDYSHRPPCNVTVRINRGLGNSMNRCPPDTGALQWDYKNFRHHFFFSPFTYLISVYIHNSETCCFERKNAWVWSALLLFKPHDILRKITENVVTRCYI